MLAAGLCFFLCMSNLVAVEAAEYEDPQIQKIYEEYKDLREFQLMREEYGQAYADDFLEAVLDSRLAELQRGGMGDVCYQYVKNLKQTKDYNCGPATILQTLYGIGCADAVSGSNDDEKVNNLTDDCKSNEKEGTMVYRATNVLNSYCNKGYIYEVCTQIAIDTFEEKVAASLTAGRPVLLHAKTGSFDYYGGKNSGHYISLDYINRTTKMVRVVDCNLDDKYYGVREVKLEEAYNSVHKESGRYIIR